MIYSFINPAKVRIAVVPLKGTTRKQFEKYVGWIKNGGTEVRLLDVQPLPNLKYFNPQSFPAGHILFDLVTEPDMDTLYLEDFEPFRKTFILVAVGPYSNEEENDNFELITQLKSMHPTCISHNILYYDTPEIKELSNKSPNVFHMSSALDIQTIMCGIASNFLIALDTYASSYSSITLRSPVDTTSNSSSLSKSIARAEKRISSGSFKGLPDAKSRAARQTGRQLKLIGSFYLLAGKWNDALQQFNEAAVVLKRAADQIWLGSALEGIAVASVLLNGDGINTSKAYSTHNRSSIHITTSALHIINTAEGSKSPRSSLSSNTSIVEDVEEFISNCTEKSLQAYEQSMSDIDDFVPDIVYAEALIRWAYYLQSKNPEITTQKLPANSSIPSTSTRASTSSSRSSIETHQISISSVLQILNRIYTLQLNELPLLIQSRIYCSLATIYSSLGLQRKRAFILRILLVQVLPKLENDAGNLPQNGFKNILDELEETYNVQMARWPSLQIPFINLCIKLCESLGDLYNTLRLCSLLLSNYTHCLSDSEQCSIKANFDKVVQQAHRSNQHVKFGYWDPNIVRNVQILSSKAKDELVPFTNDEKIPEDSFYNPYNKNIKNNKKGNFFNKEGIVIQGEIQQLKVTLQNPFAFEIDINSIKIQSNRKIQTFAVKPVVSVGSPILKNRRIATSVSSQPMSTLTISPRSKKQFLVPFKVEDVGPLTLNGFEIEVSQCAPQIYEITDTGKLELTVIKKQLNLALTNISMRNGWLMLLTGEQYQFNIELTNQSEEEVNYLSFSFWDSTVDQITQAMNTPGLLSSEMYELEHQLLSKPFKVLNKEKILANNRIAAGSTLNIEYEITARKGIRDSKIVLEYARKESDKEQTFLKYITIPLQLTVIPGLEIIGWDIHPLSEWSAQEFPQLSRLIQTVGSNLSKYCLIIVDVKNSYIEPITAKITYEPLKYEVEEKIQGSKTQRFFLPIDKISKEEIDLTARIPSLMGKQYVKNYSISDEEEMKIRTNFWLCKTILDRMNAEWWMTNDINRKGILNLRNLRISSKMASYLIETNIIFEQTILDEQGNKLEPKGSRFQLQTEIFYILKTRIANNSTKDLNGTLRYIPILSDVSSQAAGNIGRPQVLIERKILYNGVLQKKIPNIEVGSEICIDLSFTILENGSYEWGSILDGELKIIAQKPILIDAN